MTQNSKLKTMSSPNNISDGVSQSRVPAFRIIDSHLKQAKKLINEQMTGPAEAPEMNQLLEHMHCHGSEMIRPGLLLLAGKCCGKITAEHIRVAAIIEIIHNATLLHDDVIDKGQKRYNRPSVNNICGNENAVLLGDFLLGRVFQMCAVLKPQVNEVIAAAAVRICEGQLRQIAQRRNWQLSESEYIDIITEKSAVIFSTACRLGAILSQATESQTQALAEYGLNAGIAYQITDDLLEVIGHENETEKTAGNDIEKHKLNLVFIHLLSSVDEKEKEAVINSYFEHADVKYDKDALAKMLRRYSSLEYMRARAQDFVAESVGVLDLFKESDAKDDLIETVKFMACRTI
jgi:octaprenyl-diphosphate synthase